MQNHGGMGKFGAQIPFRGLMVRFKPISWPPYDKALSLDLSCEATIPHTIEIMPNKQNNPKITSKIKDFIQTLENLAQYVPTYKKLL